MERPTKLIVNASTGEETIIELTDDEIAQKEAWAAEFAAQELARQEAEAEAQANKESAISKLTALGLTEGEALALVGS